MSATNRPRYVVDASIAVKWYLEDEDFTFEALRVLDAFAGDRIALVAPDHIRYEIASALRNGVRRARLSDPVARTGLVNFLGLRLPTVGSNRLLYRGYDLALAYGCALYDGLYLVLAEYTDCLLLHADLRLRNTLDGRFPLEFWIDDYSPSSGS